MTSANQKDKIPPSSPSATASICSTSTHARPISGLSADGSPDDRNYARPDGVGNRHVRGWDCGELCNVRPAGHLSDVGTLGFNSTLARRVSIRRWDVGLLSDVEPSARNVGNVRAAGNRPS
eukprot:2894115-Rhodomonas_salina.1